VENVIHRTGQINVFGDVVLDESEGGVAGQMLNVGHVAREQVVHGNYLVPLGEQQVAQVRT
jgi:hypothetical protein